MAPTHGVTSRRRRERGGRDDATPVDEGEAGATVGRSPVVAVEARARARDSLAPPPVVAHPRCAAAAPTAPTPRPGSGREALNWSVRGHYRQKLNRCRTG